MEYHKLKITFPQLVEEEDRGIIIATLGDLGFDSFEENDIELDCYIQDKELIKHSDAISSYIKELEMDMIVCVLSKVETVNWNAVWEANFEPINVENKCYVRAPFHKEGNGLYDIVIMPKMSFGTGHHATTYLMIENLFDMDVKGKIGLDMGCGTGVLAILAVKLGARKMEAIDIDEWAVENTKENIVTNNTQESISVMQGDASLLHGRKFEFILANINRNILLEDMPSYVNVLSNGGEILFSGFLAPDVDDIVRKADSLGMDIVYCKERDGWQLVRVKKRVL